MSDLDLDGLTPVAVVVRPRAQDELAGDEIRHALLERVTRVLGDRAPCRAAEDPSVTSCHSPLCLERWLTATVKPCEGRAALGVAEFGVVGDVSD